MNKYCRELINKEQLSKNLTLQQAVEEAESALKYIEKDIILRYPVNVSMKYEFDVSYKIKTTNEMMNNYILIFDIIEYLKIFLSGYMNSVTYININISQLTKKRSNCLFLYPQKTLSAYLYH